MNSRIKKPVKKVRTLASAEPCSGVVSTHKSHACTCHYKTKEHQLVHPLYLHGLFVVFFGIRTASFSCLHPVVVAMKRRGTTGGREKKLKTVLRENEILIDEGKRKTMWVWLVMGG